MGQTQVSLHPDYAGLLAGVAANPDDDLPRLVAADWLDEHGQPERAEFIRLQIDLARRPPRRWSYRPGRNSRLGRAERLLRQHGARWVGEEVGPGVESHRYERGFVAEITADAGRAVISGDRWADRAPIRALWLKGAGQFTAELAEGRLLWRVENLTLMGTLSADAFRELLAAPLPRLARLAAGHFYGLTAEAAAAILWADGPTGLRELDVQAGLGPDWAGRVAESPRLPGLTGLSFKACRLGPGLAALIDSGKLRNLRRLHVTGDGAIGDGDVSALAGAEHMPRLEELGLRDNLLTNAAAHVLADSPTMSDLRSLDLAHNLVTSDGAVAIARSPHLSRLRVLDLDGTFVGRVGARALTGRGPNRPAVLNLDYCQLKPALARRLARSAAAAGQSVSVAACGANGWQE